jgi:hypothetical protein
MKTYREKLPLYTFLLHLNQGIKQKYPVLKNEEIRTENQRRIFAQMTQINLKTSEALAFR